MLFSWLPSASWKTVTFILITIMFTSACSSESSARSANSKASDNGILNSSKNKDKNTTANQPANITGQSTGSVTEDDDPDNDSLLETSGVLSVSDEDEGESAFVEKTSNGTYGSLIINSQGKWFYGVENTLAAVQALSRNETLIDRATVNSIDGTAHTVSITIHGQDEAIIIEDAANSPAIISGTDTGEVTEDLDGNKDGKIAVQGKLNITDNDPGEASFISSSFSSYYGNFSIDSTGNWAYVLKNDLNAIQSLNTGESLQDNLTIKSIDGTTHVIRITIFGADEATEPDVPEETTNTPATITGTSTGEVTEDFDGNQDGVIAASGKLDIVDVDPYEAAFVAGSVSGNYGVLDISADGNWLYTLNNDHITVQSLNDGEMISDSMTVRSIDGSKQTITVTIIGADEPGINTNTITLSWGAPSEREDNQPISLSEISGYRIYYSNTQGDYNDSISINDGSAQEYTFSDFSTGIYYFVITTVDTGGRESQQSAEIRVEI